MSKCSAIQGCDQGSGFESRFGLEEIPLSPLTCFMNLTQMNKNCLKISYLQNGGDPGTYNTRLELCIFNNTV